MIDLIRKCIDECYPGGLPEYDLKITNTMLSAEGRTLRIFLSSDLVLPAKAEDTVRAVITDLIGINDVLFVYDYHDIDGPNKALSLRNYVRHLIKEANGDYTSLTSSIIEDGVELEYDSLLIPVTGKVAAKMLNDRLSSMFRELIRKDLGVSVDVVFVRDEGAAETIIQEVGQEVIRELRKDAEDAEKRAEIARKALKDEGGKPALAEDESDTPKRASGKWAAAAMERKAKNAEAKGDILMGIKEITGKSTPLSGIDPDMGTVTVEGRVFGSDERTIRSGEKLVSYFLADKSGSGCIKSFVSEAKYEELAKLIKNGDYIKARGKVEWDRYEDENVVVVSSIMRAKETEREDNHPGMKRVELHCHTKMSALDGLNDVGDLVAQAAKWGHSAVAITDHGVVQAFPDAYKAAKKAGNIRIIFGMEGYVFDDSDCRRDDGSIDYKRKDTNHIILLAATQEGLQNLYRLVSISHLDYFYKRPRLPRSVISEYREGIIIGSACEAGEVYRAVARGASDEELDRIASFYDYLEIQPLINNRFMIENGSVEGVETLKAYNRRVIECADRLGKLTAATTDSHYGNPEDAIFRNIIMAGMGYKDAENGQGLFLRTTDEMLEEFSYLGEERAYEVVVENTNKIAEMIDPDIRPVPKGTFYPSIENAAEILRESCLKRAHEVYGEELPEVIEERLMKELNSVISNHYEVMYVSAQMLVKKSMSDGYLVGSRGSVGSSFLATMAGITEVNPLEPHYLCPKCKHLEWGDMNLYDVGVDMPEKDCPVCGTPMKRDGFTIPFATFLGFEGNKTPDIDLNFAGEYQPIAHRFVGNIFGEKNVYKAGTVSGIKDRTAFGFVKKYAEETGRKFGKYETARLAKGCEGVKRTTGQHPGGIVIVPEGHSIEEFCPVQHPANDAESDIITTHFDFHKIDENLLKLDILGHTVPSMIRQLYELTGVDPLKADLADRKVLSIFNGTEALDIKDPDYKFVHGTYGIPEFGTNFVRRMLDDIKPERFADLVRISGFSHGTAVWKGNAQDYIKSGVATMREVISTRDDIMNYLILKGLENETAFKIMEIVRKNRPLTDDLIGLMKEHGVPDWYIDSCIKIQYMFPRAHAAAYTMMSFRLAWYKVYYPAEFYATSFGPLAGDFNAEVILGGKDSVLARIEEINAKGLNASKKEQDELIVYELAYEMYARGLRFRAPQLGVSKASQFWVEDGDVILPFSALENVGENAAKSLVQAYAERPFSTVEEISLRARINKAAIESLRKMHVLDGLAETDQLSFF